MGTRAAASGNARAVKLRLPCRQQELELAVVSGLGTDRGTASAPCPRKELSPGSTERFAHTDVNGNFVEKSPIIRKEQNELSPV